MNIKYTDNNIEKTGITLDSVILVSGQLLILPNDGGAYIIKNKGDVKEILL